MAANTLITAEQFAQMTPAETEDFELVEGDLIPLASPTPLHARICLRIGRSLDDYLTSHAMGDCFPDVDCRLSSDTVRRPDVSVFLGREIDLRKSPIPFAPDIAVEVLSPSETTIETNRKIQGYLTAGTQEVWIVDQPNREIFQYTNKEIRLFRGAHAFATSLLPGFSLTVEDLLVNLPSE